MNIAKIAAALSLVACTAETTGRTESADTTWPPPAYEGTGTFGCAFPSDMGTPGMVRIEDLGIVGKAPKITGTVIGEHQPLDVLGVGNIVVFTGMSGSYSSQVAISREQVYAIKSGAKFTGIVVESSNQSAGASRSYVATCSRE